MSSASEFETLRAAYQQVTARIAAAAARSGRRPGDITLVAVTKSASLEQILSLIEIGHRDLGENRVQQLEERVSAVALQLGPRTSVRWHMIGHLQRNKVKSIAPLAHLIHSIDSARLAEELNSFAAKRAAAASEGGSQRIDILLQVNIAEEQQKFGLSAAAAPALAEQIAAQWPHLRLRGLMTMAPYSDIAEDSRPVFAQLAALFRRIKEQPWAGGEFNVLSMGMTGDFEVAIEEGATLVRVGRALFEEA